MNQVTLAINMLFILKTQGIVKKESIAEQLEISLKMVQRLRVQLETAGYGILVIKGRYGGYKLTNNSFLPVSDLTSEELTELAIAFNSLKKLQLPFITHKFKNAYQKVIANIPTQFPSISLIQTQELLIDPYELEATIAVLQKAIQSQSIVTIRYSNNKEYNYEPYEVFQVDYAWYVIGYQWYKDVRVFRLDRIINIIINDKTFIKTKDFNLAQYLNDTGFKIEKPMILKGYLKDSTYLLEFRLSDHQIVEGDYFEIKFYSIARAKRFILEQGSKLKILEPHSLKEFQRNEALKVLELY